MRNGIIRKLTEPFQHGVGDFERRENAHTDLN
jgi:hypothetical protein